jgi:hypothetical protein
MTHRQSLTRFASLCGATQFYVNGLPPENIVYINAHCPERQVYRIANGY